MRFALMVRCRGVMLRAIPMILLVTGAGRSGPAAAQVTPPRTGVELPPGYYERIREDPDAFQFRRAWKGQTLRARENRERNLREGRLSPASLAGARVEGTRRIPVLAGTFTNTGPDPYSETDLEDRLFNGPHPTGTVTDYYTEVSYGLVTLTGDVIGAAGGGLFPVSGTDLYYEGSCNGLCGSARTGEFLKELLDGTDSRVDFSQYDNDGPDGVPNSGDDDGYVDFVAFVHPERGGECGGSNIWSHRWVYEGWWGSPYVTDDPAAGGGFIRVSDYTIQPLVSCDGTSLIEIGVFAHEFGHAFGLPDLYDTDSGDGSSAGVGEWCLMGSGSWGGDGAHPETPSHMSAWCKEELGWVDPVVVCADEPGASLPAVAGSPSVLKVFPHGAEDPEYFLIENRVRTGFDQWLHGDGIAVWHIDTRQSGNGDETHKLVDLEEADGLGQLDLNANRGDAGDVFPGAAAVGWFDDDTVPDARDTFGNPTGFSLGGFTAGPDPRAFAITVTGCRLAVGDVAVEDGGEGNHSGTLDPDEIADLRIGLRNDFPTLVSGVTGILTSLSPEVSVLEGSLSFGTVTPDALAFGIQPARIQGGGNLPDGTRLDFELALTGDNGYSSTSVFPVYAGKYVVLVEDDAAADNAALFLNAIAAAGYAVVHHDTAVDGLPPLGLLRGALAVVWYTGIEGYDTFSPVEQDLVAAFLEGGGALYVSGQDLGWGLVEQGSAADRAFYETYLHATYVADTSNDNTLVGVAGDPVGNGLSLNLSGGTGANNSTWPSEIAPRTGASAVFRYGVTRDAAVRYAGDHRLVYTAFNYEAINIASVRNTVMQRILDWLTPSDLTPPVITLLSPAPGDTVSACSEQTVTWTATDNDQVAEVDLWVSADSGTTWTPVAEALPNTGSTTWTVGGLAGSAVRLRLKARDPAGLQGVDQTDDLPVGPGVPVVEILSPNGGEWIGSGASFPVVWSLSDSCGSGLDSTRVYLSLDAGAVWTHLATVAAPGTTWTVPAMEVFSDSALMRVVGFDVDGNSGADTSDAVFRIVDETPPTVALVAPNGGDSYTGGSVVPVEATLLDDAGIDSVRISVSLDDGVSWTEVETGPLIFPYDWTTPAVSSALTRLRIEAWDGAGNTAADTSDAPFALQAPTTVPPGWQGITRPVLLQNFPNPMEVSGTTLAFVLPEDGPVTLEIYGLGGNRVRQLVRGAMPAGYHQVDWDGRDDGGRPVAPGVYFSVLEAGSRRQAKKLIRVR